jgi:hypothetical protein
MTRREFVRTVGFGITLLPLRHHRSWHTSAKPKPPPSSNVGKPMGLLLALTYP